MKLSVSAEGYADMSLESHVIIATAKRELHVVIATAWLHHALPVIIANTWVRVYLKTAVPGWSGLRQRHTEVQEGGVRHRAVTTVRTLQNAL